uniref:Uncharacterized protein n=1 Tax=Rhizophora mucronata TaxID=61149 RepID=A0A2P2NDR9_RHIMU
MHLHLVLPLNWSIYGLYMFKQMQIPLFQLVSNQSYTYFPMNILICDLKAISLSHGNKPL